MERSRERGGGTAKDVTTMRREGSFASAAEIPGNREEMRTAVSRYRPSDQKKWGNSCC